MGSASRAKLVRSSNHFQRQHFSTVGLPCQWQNPLIFGGLERLIAFICSRQKLVVSGQESKL